MADKHFTRLLSSEDGFNQMIQRFGVVTVMNVRVYEWFDFNHADPSVPYTPPYVIYKGITTRFTPICTLDTLKISNISIEGPSKTLSGGRYANPIIKFGKTARLEMQDALGHIDAIDALCGGIAERTGGQGGQAGDYIGLHIGEDFNTPKLSIGDTFFSDQATQQQVPAAIIFYKFLPDSLFNLTQDAEGDAAVFDMNGDLLPMSVLLGTNESKWTPHDVFYSIIDPIYEDGI